MKNEFSNAMARLTDAELIDMVNNQRNDFNPRAIEAAESELENRNLSFEKIQETTQEVEAKNQIATQKANEELDIGWRVLTFLFPGMFILMLGALYKSNGYKRKSKELASWTLYGFCFYIGIIALIVLIHIVF